MAGTVPDLYQRILERYEEDYERERPGLVREVMSLLWAARHGLSEAEVLDLLGPDDRPLPQSYWAPLYLAAEQALVNRGGVFSFSHDYVRQAVQRRYVVTPKYRHDLHFQLAGYFARATSSVSRVEESRSAQAGTSLPSRPQSHTIRFFVQSTSVPLRTITDTKAGVQVVRRLRWQPSTSSEVWSVRCARNKTFSADSSCDLP